MTAAKWNDLKGAIVKVLGVLMTTWSAALTLDLVDTHAKWGKFGNLGATVLIAYGIYGAYTYRAPRTPWTDEQKRAESMKMIAAGQPPIAGYEFLLKDPTATAPPATTTTATPAPPPPIRGA